jgi:hypothetical protein
MAFLEVVVRSARPSAGRHPPTGRRCKIRRERSTTQTTPAVEASRAPSRGEGVTCTASARLSSPSLGARYGDRATDPWDASVGAAPPKNPDVTASIATRALGAM